MSWAFLPFVSGAAWIGTILGLLIPWLVQGRPTLPSFDPGQTIAFISDLGAFNFKPLFIGGSVVTIAFYIATLFAERSLRHRIVPGHPTCGEMMLTALVFLGAGLGGGGLILLSIFDNFHFKSTHDKLVGVFIAGNLISAIVLLIEYLAVIRRHTLSPTDQRLAKKSFVMKLIFVILEIVATAAFAAAQTVDKSPHHEDLAAVLEYVNAFLFAWFILSFVFDLKKHPSAQGYKTMPSEYELGKASQMPMNPQWHGTKYRQHEGVAVAPV